PDSPTTYAWLPSVRRRASMNPAVRGPVSTTSLFAAQAGAGAAVCQRGVVELPSKATNGSDAPYHERSPKTRSPAARYTYGATGPPFGASSLSTCHASG